MSKPAVREQNGAASSGLLVEFFTGLGCSNRCLFCSDESDRHRTRFITLRDPDRLRAHLENLPLHQEIRFGGFEPTTNPKLPLFCEIARDMGFRRIAVGTNGRRFHDRNYLETLVKSGMNTVSLSMHGHTAELHDALTGRQGSFEQARLGLSHLRDLKREGATLAYSLHTVVVRANAPHLEAIAHFFQDFDPEEICFLMLKLTGQARTAWRELMEPYPDLVALTRTWNLDSFRVKTGFLNLPFCVSARMSPRLFGWHETVNLVQSDTTKDSVNLNLAFVKRAACEGCAAGAICPGVIRDYAEKLGWEGLTPLTPTEWETFQRELNRYICWPPDRVFMGKTERLEMIRPFDQGPQAGWRLDRHEAKPDSALYHFVHETGLEIGLKLLEPGHGSAFASTKRFDICFDGETIPPAAQRFWDTLVKVVQINAARAKRE